VGREFNGRKKGEKIRPASLKNKTDEEETLGGAVFKKVAKGQTRETKNN